MHYLRETECVLCESRKWIWYNDVTTSYIMCCGEIVFLTGREQYDIQAALLVNKIRENIEARFGRHNHLVVCKSFMEDCMSNNVLDGFFGGQNENDAVRLQNAMENASSTEGNSKLEISGKYRMRVVSRKFKGRDNTVMEFPNVSISTNTKSLMLTVCLEVVDGTPTVPAGSYRYENIVLSPRAGAPEDDYKKIARMSKPRLAALMGVNNIDNAKFDKDFICNNLLTTFEQVGEEYEVVKENKLTYDVMVTYEDEVYNNKGTLSMKRMVAAKEGDASVSNAVPVDNAPQSIGETAQNAAAASDADYDAIASVMSGASSDVETTPY